MTEKRFFVTFGQRYSRERHPVFRRAHPDGWLMIKAGSEDEAREIAFSAIGDAWSMSYTEAQFRKIRHHYPKGELGVLTFEDAHCDCGHQRRDHTSYQDSEYMGSGLGECLTLLGCSCSRFCLAVLAPAVNRV